MNNFLFTLLVLMMMCGDALSQQTVSARITNFNNDKGVCRACIFDNATAFKGKGKAIQCVSVVISGKSATATFSKIPDGTYAISLFHDANNNNKFDTNFFGIPKEGYGASGNNLPFAAAPTFSGNKFEIKGKGLNLSIRLRYL